jgi:hypothetical protein
MVPVLAAGCAGETSSPEAPPETTTPSVPPGTAEVASTCVGCHTDKALLQKTATEVEEEKSEATSGEG